jgi:hypothetical protein
MSRLEDLQPTAVSYRIMPVQVVTTVCAATMIDRANILHADNALVVDLQGVEEDFCLRGTRFLDARFVAPDLQESET